MEMSPTTHRLVELALHGAVIVRAPDTMVVLASHGEPWFDMDDPWQARLLHPAVTRWLEALIVAPAVAVSELDVTDRVRILLAALDAHAVATEWSTADAVAPGPPTTTEALGSG